MFHKIMIDLREYRFQALRLFLIFYQISSPEIIFDFLIRFQVIRLFFVFYQISNLDIVFDLICGLKWLFCPLKLKSILHACHNFLEYQMIMPLSFQLSCKEENLLLYSDDRENAQQWSEELEKAIRWILVLKDVYQTLKWTSAFQCSLTLDGSQLLASIMARAF